MMAPRPQVHALIVAAGLGVRAGAGIPKQYRHVRAEPLLAHALHALLDAGPIDHVSVVIRPDDRLLYDAAVAPFAGDDRLLPPIAGGATRQASVLAGLEALAARPTPPDLVLVHDAARAFVPADLIARLLAAFDTPEVDGAAPALPVVDSLRRAADGRFHQSVDRDGLLRVQTPQAFRFAALLDAHRAASEGATDEVAIALSAGLRVATVTGDEAAFKVTEVADFERAEQVAARPLTTRLATGYDVHCFGPGDHVWLCGIRVPHEAGLIGHSDADAGLHALTDAILGCLAAGDIGDHFPPSDPQWKGASSDRFLAHAAGLVQAAGGRIDHLDVTLICERPKIGPHREAMRQRIADIAGICPSRVSVKATTTEGLGFTGRREGLAAQAAATIRLPDIDGERE